MRTVRGLTGVMVNSMGPDRERSGESAIAAEDGRIIARVPAETTAFKASRREKSMAMVRPHGNRETPRCSLARFRAQRTYALGDHTYTPTASGCSSCA